MIEIGCRCIDISKIGNDLVNNDKIFLAFYNLPNKNPVNLDIVFINTAINS